jgi:hypothetical protein
MSYIPAIDENLLQERPRTENPRHTGKPHSSKAKKKIAASMRRHYKQLYGAVQNAVSEERVREIISETIRDYFANNLVETNNRRPNIPIE